MSGVKIAFSVADEFIRRRKARRAARLTSEGLEEDIVMEEATPVLKGKMTYGSLLVLAVAGILNGLNIEGLDAPTTAAILVSLATGLYGRYRAKK
jgi:hypothetical protein